MNLASGAEATRSTIKAVAAASIGNVIEWFGFVSYSYVAQNIAKEFFPSQSAVAGLISVFGILALASFVRPLGAMIFGPLGDRIGRRKVLSATILLLSGSTAAIGLLPSYHQIGIMAPILLVLLRLLQGLSQGGEFTSAVTYIAEYSPDAHRGFFCSLVSIGVRVGFLAASSMVSLLVMALAPGQFDAWGWRVCFLMALPLGLVGVYLRTQIDETPAFRAARQTEHVRPSSLGETFRETWRAMLVLILSLIVMQVGSYTVLTYMPTYLSVTLHLARAESLGVANVLILSAFVIIPLAGWLSDRIGRKPVLAIGCGGFLLFSYPAFVMISSGHTVFVFLGVMVLGLFLDLLLGAYPAMMVEIFPTRMRSGGAAIAYNLCVAVFGGLTPVVLTAHIATTGNVLIPAYYLTGAALVSIVSIRWIRETAGKPLWIADS